MPKSPEQDIPSFVRRCWDSYQSATTHLRKASRESLKMWLGGAHQWRAGEVAARIAANRPFITINRCKPVVDQVENEALSNPPGPQARPVGGGADTDGADILEGLIREYEYRSDAARAYITALRYAAAGNYGVFELATEYDGERSFEQRLTVKEAEDPSMYFVDPDARRACREDAMWGGKIRVLSRDKLIEEYGTSLKVLNRNLVDRAAGWMQSAVGWRGESATVNLWTGGAAADGPYYVCEFYRVKIERDTLRRYSDNIDRFDDEKAPAGVTPKLDPDGEEIKRSEPRPKVKKYVVTALDTLDETEWYGDIIPHFWVMGPEIYIDGKLYRLSLIDPAADAQRGLNYTATAATEVVGNMTKAPWIGWVGQFDVANAQGQNPWESSNTKMWAYMEVKPTFATDPATGQSQLLPAPQRNTWEAPIGRLMELATFFVESIKGATAMFFDPSIQSARNAQSGEAVKALQAQSNLGTAGWQANLHRAVALSYGQAAKILPKIMDGPRVKTIVRADSNHELVEINREFPGGIDPATGKKGKRNNIVLGEYSLRVLAGPSTKTRTEKSISALIDVFRIAPGLLGAPGVAAQFLRMVGEGSPQVEQMADSLIGKQGEEQTPEQLQNQLLQLQQSSQAKDQMLQQLQQALQSKLPELEVKKWIAALDALTKIRAAEITASKDADNAQADRDAAALENLTTMAHEAALQATDHEHQVDQAQQAQDTQAARQQQEQPTTL